MSSDTSSPAITSSGDQVFVVPTTGTPTDIPPVTDRPPRKGLWDTLSDIYYSIPLETRKSIGVSVLQNVTGSLTTHSCEGPDVSPELAETLRSFQDSTDVVIERVLDDIPGDLPAIGDCDYCKKSIHKKHDLIPIDNIRSVHVVCLKEAMNKEERQSYEEERRKYLLETTEFPHEFVLKLTPSAKTELYENKELFFPYARAFIGHEDIKVLLLGTIRNLTLDDETRNDAMLRDRISCLQIICGV